MSKREGKHEQRGSNWPFALEMEPRWEFKEGKRLKHTARSSVLISAGIRERRICEMTQIKGAMSKWWERRVSCAGLWFLEERLGAKALFFLFLVECIYKGAKGKVNFQGTIAHPIYHMGPSRTLATYFFYWVYQQQRWCFSLLKKICHKPPKKFRILRCKPTDKLMIMKYQHLVVKLIFLTITQPKSHLLSVKIVSKCKTRKRIIRILS